MNELFSEASGLYRCPVCKYRTGQSDGPCLRPACHRAAAVAHRCALCSELCPHAGRGGYEIRAEQHRRVCEKRPFAKGDYVRWQRTTRNMWCEGELTAISDDQSIVHIAIEAQGGQWTSGYDVVGKTERCDGPMWSSVTLRRIPRPVVTGETETQWKARLWPAACPSCEIERMGLNAVSHGCERWCCSACDDYYIRQIPQYGLPEPEMRAGTDFDVYVANEGARTKRPREGNQIPLEPPGPRICGVFAHPDDVDAVFEHDAIWENGTAAKVTGDRREEHGLFRINWEDGTSKRFPVPKSRCTCDVLRPAPHAEGCEAVAPAAPTVEDFFAATAKHLTNPEPGLSNALYGGLTAEQCLARYVMWQRANDIATPEYMARNSLTPAQLECARVMWSAQLRRSVRASDHDAAARRPRVLITPEFDPCD